MKNIKITKMRREKKYTLEKKTRYFPKGVSECGKKKIQPEKKIPPFGQRSE